MPCACQKGKKDQVFVFVSSAGAETEYATEIQARAAVVRAGGGRVVPRAK